MCFHLDSDCQKLRRATRQSRGELSARPNFLYTPFRGSCHRQTASRAELNNDSCRFPSEAVFRLTIWPLKALDRPTGSDLTLPFFVVTAPLNSHGQRASHRVRYATAPSTNARHLQSQPIHQLSLCHRDRWPHAHANGDCLIFADWRQLQDLFFAPCLD